MARSSTHTRQKAKNFFMLAVLVLFVGGLYYLTILKQTGV